ncbi:DUF6125 family protein [Chloroflexota bacterium]
MTELIDYSGEFSVDTKYEHFSRELLLEAIKAYAEYAYRVDAFWYLTVKGRWDGSEATSCNMTTMQKTAPYEVKIVRQLFNIQEDNVAGFMKFQQMRPWSWILSNTQELKGPNYGIFTITRCPILEGMEKEGEGREMETCHNDHVIAIRLQASCFNPKIKIEPLKLPPRSSADEIACQWEFKLEE